LAIASLAHAQSTITPQVDYLKKIDSARTLSALDQNLFGDNINDYTGAVTFSVTDVELPGNSALRVAIARKFDVNEVRSRLGAHRRGGSIHDWDFDIPHLHGSFATSTGWQAGTTANLRCGQSNLAQAAPPTIPPSATASISFASDDYWHGNMLYVPGQGDDEILHLADSATVKPGDGQAYHWVTKGHWYFSCLATTANGVAGDAFLARAPDGTKYWFNQVVGQKASVSGVQKGSDGSLPRMDVWMMPTRVEDRFGNWVTYTYSAADQGNIVAINANDSRQLTVTYRDGVGNISLNGSGYVDTVSDGTRTWTYGYTAGSLTSVTLPDSSKLIYNFSAFNADGSDIAFDGCGSLPQSMAWYDFVATVTHPSGAVGTFTFDYKQHGRSYVPKNCWYATNGSGDRIPPVFAVLSLTKKTISGPGIAAAPTWSWTYPALQYSYDAQCAAGCPTTKLITVTQPDGSVLRQTFGVRYGVNDGMLLQSDVLNGSTTLKSRTVDYQIDPTGQAYPAHVGDPFKLLNDPGTGVLRPIRQKKTTQDGATFTWQVNNASGVYSFDSYARPLSVTKSSTLGYSRTEATAYSDNLTKFVLGQVKSVTKTAPTPSVVMESTTYDATTALPTAKYEFGNPTASERLAYCNQTITPGCTLGTLYTVTDGRNDVTSFTNWKRGIPQTILYPNSKTKSAVVNNAGWIDSITDENAYKTSYGHDSMGRLTSIAYPTGDTVAWNSMTQTFAPIATAEYGLAAGHWKQTTTTGNAHKETYFDALWRPVITTQYDSANKTNTQRTTVQGYDAVGHLNYTSYPQRTVSSYSDRSNTTNKTYGIASTYDALGRETQKQTYSELGQLTTTTTYSTTFKKTVQDPRNNSTTFYFQAFDEPSYDRPYQISAPETLSITINRDEFGKPTSIVRSGTNQVDGTAVSAKRSYVYDGYQRLCKTIEPEIGATVRDYDAANNVAWISTGFPLLTSVASCDRTDTGVIAAKVSRSYDTLNRLTDIAGIAQPVHRTYTPDGLEQTVSAGSVLWTYGYNKRRLLTTEALSGAGVVAASLANAYDGNGSLKSMTYPDSVQVDYAPNALGEPTQAKKGTTSYATSVSTYPNGAIQGFTYGNGVVHSLVQNARGLPQESKDVGVLDDVYTYDADADVTSITDNLQSVTTRSMTYDNLDRLKTANAAGVWGTATYKYDALDNLRSSIVGSRNYTHAYDASNRLQALKSGTTTVMSFTYDQQGNVNQRGTQTFQFDRANQIQVTTGAQPVNNESYAYDGNGRRVKITRAADGTHHYMIYSKSGQLRYEMDDRTKGITDYIYLGHSLIAREDSALTAATVKYLHTDGLGSPVATSGSTGTVLSRTRYEPYGAPSNGSYADGPGFTGHYTDAATQLTYMQQRYYDPIAGRFLSNDPVPADANSGTSFNRYAYALNNPYKNIDPDGRRSTVVGDEVLLDPEDKTVPKVEIKNTVGAEGISTTDLFFHTYNVETASNLTPSQASEGLRDDPTPGDDSPASPSGTKNDVGYIPVLPGPNRVNSFLVPSPNPTKLTDIVVNYTIRGEHKLTEGFVIRFGMIGGDGKVTLRSYGEGNNWHQMPALNGIWGPQVEEIWQKNQKEIIDSVH